MRPCTKSLGLAAILVALLALIACNQQPAAKDPWSDLRLKTQTYIATQPGAAPFKTFLDGHYNLATAAAEKTLPNTPDGWQMGLPSYFDAVRLQLVKSADAEFNTAASQFLQAMARPQPGP